MLHLDAGDLMTRLNQVPPTDAADTRALDHERGWVEAIEYLSRKGLLTPGGEAEAAAILAATTEWLDDLSADALVLPPVPDADMPAIVAGPARPARAD